MTEKVTPKGDLSWYVKWVASGLGILGAILTALGLAPFNLFAGLLCFMGWAFVGIRWNDRALILMNTFLAGVYCISIISSVTGVDIGQ